MVVRILVGIMILGLALRVSRSFYRDIKRTESGTESRYMYGFRKVDIWREPIPKGKRTLFALALIIVNVLLYLLAAVILFDIHLSTVFPF